MPALYSSASKSASGRPVRTNGAIGKSADTNADEYSAGMLVGYDFVVRNYTIGPRVSVDWIQTDYDRYREKGESGLELTFYNDEETSLQSTLGVEGSAAFSTSYGVFLPQVTFAWKHEFDDDQRKIDVSFAGDTESAQFSYKTERPDRDFFELNVGLVFVTAHGVQVYGNYRTLRGHSYFDSHAGILGLRVDF